MVLEYAGNVIDDYTLVPTRGCKYEFKSSAIHSLEKIVATYTVFVSQPATPERYALLEIEDTASGSPTSVPTRIPGGGNDLIETPAVYVPTPKSVVETFTAAELGLPSEMEANKTYSFYIAPKGRAGILNLLRSRRDVVRLDFAVALLDSTGAPLLGTDATAFTLASEVPLR